MCVRLAVTHTRINIYTLLIHVFTLVYQMKRFNRRLHLWVAVLIGLSGLSGIHSILYNKRMGMAPMAPMARRRLALLAVMTERAIGYAIGFKTYGRFGHFDHFSVHFGYFVFT